MPVVSGRTIAPANSFGDLLQLDKAMESASMKTSCRVSFASSNPFTDFNGLFFKDVDNQYSSAYDGSKAIDARMMVYARLVDIMVPERIDSSIAKALELDSTDAVLQSRRTTWLEGNSVTLVNLYYSPGYQMHFVI